VLLVNGRLEPELEIAAGQVERWRVVNAANTRFVRLSIGGRPFSILGTDGGLVPAPLEVAEILLTPGERADLAVGPFAEGELLESKGCPTTVVAASRAATASPRSGSAPPRRRRRRFRRRCGRSSRWPAPMTDRRGRSA
jgi:FtsP/CotA-like multicopper oxidase with cupredoxin domain